ncbi:thioredoxin [Clostridium sp. Marseille-P299]|uniref:thioredoxin n=1 Tax=Clostridium sp. Marseille-P299 TaxID=1805477 RepID=UPI00083191AE|nr:thioredoxin [Clostridium sp. Marseille-P299]
MSILTLTKHNFKSEVLSSKVPVLIDFWAPWCGPCRMIAPLVEEISKEKGEEIKVGKINIDEHPDLAQMFKVMSIPTLIVVNEGKVTASSVGLKPKESILELLNA